MFLLDCIHQLLDGHKIQSPTVQVVSISKLRQGLVERECYNLDIFDGTHVHQASLLTRYNKKITMGEIMTGSII